MRGFKVHMGMPWSNMVSPDHDGFCGRRELEQTPRSAGFLYGVWASGVYKSEEIIPGGVNRNIRLPEKTDAIVVSSAYCWEFW